MLAKLQVFREFAVAIRHILTIVADPVANEIFRDSRLAKMGQAKSPESMETRNLALAQTARDRFEVRGLAFAFGLKQKPSVLDLLRLNVFGYSARQTWIQIDLALCCCGLEFAWKLLVAPNGCANVDYGLAF